MEAQKLALGIFERLDEVTLGVVPLKNLDSALRPFTRLRHVKQRLFDLGEVRLVHRDDRIALIG